MKIVYNTVTKLVIDVLPDESKLSNLKADLDWTFGDCDESDIGKSIDTLTLDKSDEAVEKLAESDCCGEMIRVIEDLADAITALGGSLPQTALDKIQRRKDLRDEL